MKNKIALSFMLLIASTAFLVAQDAAAVEAIDKQAGATILGNTLLLLGLAAIVGGIAGMLRLNKIIMESTKLRLIQEYGVEAVEKMGFAQQDPWWKRQYKAWTNVVPVEKEQDILLNHDYDGIQELDNSLPPWWVAMFYITIFIGGIYMVYYHVTDMGLGQEEQYEVEMKEAEEAVAAFLASQADAVDETNAEMLTDEGALAQGGELFVGKCAACHGQLGEGGVGPNLTDAYWLHGGDIKDVFKSIKYGIPEKGMIAWQAQLPPADIHKIASYILTLRGTNPPNAKEPQGELFQATIDTPVDTTASEMIGMN